MIVDGNVLDQSVTRCVVLILSRLMMLRSLAALHVFRSTELVFLI